VSFPVVLLNEHQSSCPEQMNMPHFTALDMNKLSVLLTASNLATFHCYKAITVVNSYAT
jgi:hypothetical protein